MAKARVKVAPNYGEDNRLIGVKEVMDILQVKRSKAYKSGFLNSCEIIICMWNKGHKWNFTKQNEIHNFFESPICMQPERLKEPKHPAQKPVKLLKHIINIASNPDDVVFDPFMGVGSTGVACAELGRRFVGCEIDNTYYSAAKERLGGIK
ncbi:MAG: site-specific DNA-methyltransferase [Clostridiales bacterium]|nr:site-specific DNA-methyltransferase [Clostridiales bacterium]